ncbi:thyroid hormone receptor beta [Daphnia magna]|uniref:Uncharacterized protein n=1 Tax=Daphnia magna TaxID=35525 RepID=A0ABQ9ZCB6_9CRUS|nr:thyroid hormone receptor beta [Daphnia magna]KAK4010544.1 hypothetical protein OUZ56_019690 [Daphnia magna]
MMSRSFPPFDSIIQELAQKLDVEDETLLCSEKMFEKREESYTRCYTKEKVEKPCVVCGDHATGCHYKCWTCEGCKGFFRRSLSKKGTYTCDWGNNCIVDKFSRTQCQKCRYDKCIAMGMVSNATHIYVPSGQKVKCVVRESNAMPVLKVTSARRRVMKPTMPDTITDLLNPIVRAYRETFTRIGPSRSTTLNHAAEINCLASLHMADMLTPTIGKVITFAKALAGFNTFTTDDQICLLLGSCIEVLCLRTALRFDVVQQGFPLRGEQLLTRSDVLAQPELGMLSPLFSYAQRIADLKLDETEAAILVATWILQSSRPDLKEPEGVEVFQESIMNVAMSYAKNGPHGTDELRWLKTLMARSPPLLGISVRAQTDKLAIYLLIEHVATLPLSFLHLFEEDD